MGFQTERIKMRRITLFRIKTRAALSAATAAVVLLAANSAVRADDPAKILKAMTDYLGAQTTLSASFDSDLEVITPELQKIQFSSSGQLKLSRPDKLRIRRTGGYADVELVYDGKMLSLYGNNAKSYVQADLPGTIDKIIDTLQTKTGASMPGTDLLLEQILRRADGKYHRRQAHRPGRRRWCRVRTSGVSRRRHRLADLDRNRRASGAAQIRHHQQDAGRRAAIHLAHQGLEDRCDRGCGRLRVQGPATRPRLRSTTA